MALVAEKGVRAVSFREVARRAGVSHQAPYHHFGDHKGILLAIAKEGFAALGDALDTAASARSDPLDALTASGLAYVRFAEEHVGHFRVMFQHDLVDVFADQQPLPEAECTFGVLMRLSETAVQGGYGVGLTAPEIAHLCWSCVHGLANLLVEGVLMPKAQHSDLDQRAIVNQVVTALTRLLRGP